MNSRSRTVERNTNHTSKARSQERPWRFNTPNCILLPLIHIITIWGMFHVSLTRKTFYFGVVYGHLTGIGIIAGHHRLWSHQSYNASLPLQIFLALFAAGALQGSIKWWAREHRAHHRYTDTDKDPHNIKYGFFWAYVGWQLVSPPKGERWSGWVDVGDLKKDKVVVWQERFYVPLAMIMGIVVPTVVPWMLWDDLAGGFVYAFLLRTCIVLQIALLGNALAHVTGEKTFGDRDTARDHILTALLTLGDGYHNFHHQFPMDYRTTSEWYQYDPTKWFIWSMMKLGLASDLRTIPKNEIQKGALSMQLLDLRKVQDDLVWPTDREDLPTVSWDSFREQSSERPLIVIAGFIHDLRDFVEEHPGGAGHIRDAIGRDVTNAFFGGVYGHSNAAYNLLCMKRVGVLWEEADSQFDEGRVASLGQSMRIVEDEGI